MLLFARKKCVRDDRILQLILILSLLRGSPNLFDGEADLNALLDADLTMGASLGRAAQSAPSRLSQELDSKSLDRILGRYQLSILEDLNNLGSYDLRNDSIANPTRQRRVDNDIQAYLLNAESSLTNAPANAETSSALGLSSDNLFATDADVEEFLSTPHLLPDEDPYRDHGHNLFEELDYLDSIWKQDVDLGLSKELMDIDLAADGSGWEVEDAVSKRETETLMEFKLREKDFDIEPFSNDLVLEMDDSKSWMDITNVTSNAVTGGVFASPGDSVEIAAAESVVANGSVKGDQEDRIEDLQTEEENRSKAGTEIEEGRDGDNRGEGGIYADDDKEEADEAPLVGPPSSLWDETSSVGSALSSAHPDQDLDDFDLEEALRLVGIETPSTHSLLFRPKSIDEECEEDSGCGESAGSESGGEGGSPLDDLHAEPDPLDSLYDSLDEMIHASELHNHQPGYQGRGASVSARPGAMEQRWQDLASFLSLPTPSESTPHPQTPMGAVGPQQHHQSGQPVIHHPHAVYPPPHPEAHGSPGHPGAVHVPRGVVIHNATLPPPLPDAHNITFANSMGASSHLGSAGMGGPDPTNHESQHYKMEASAGTVGAVPQEMMYYQNSGPEMQAADGFLSSILNDEDLQLMDIPMNDYNGRGPVPDYAVQSYRYHPQDDGQRMAPVAQKKHQMYGKRYFHEHSHMATSPPNITASTNMTGSMPLIGSNYTHYPSPHQTHHHPHMDGAQHLNHSEMKYSCTMDFRPEISGVSLDHVQHNHTYHMSSEGPSGVSRPHSKDRKGKKGDNERHLTRDEKRAISLNLPITCDDIINLPMDEFNDRISKFDLTESQLSLIRDIRRRGKNKVAAQNCRKRKLDQIIHLAEEVRVFQYRKSDLLVQCERLKAERHRAKHKLSLLYRHIFQCLRDPEGNAYSPDEYVLQQTSDGSMRLVPRQSLVPDMGAGGSSGPAEYPSAPSAPRAVKEHREDRPPHHQ